MTLRMLPAFILGAIVWGAALAGAADVKELESAFKTPPDNARIMVRWWWFGPAVTKPELEREMKTMKAGGIGGFEVQPTYPMALDGELPGLVNLKFMSPEFLDCLGFTAAKARELGLRMDLTLGSGWPYGGPQFPATEAAARIVSQRASAAAGAKSVTLPRLGTGQSLIAAFAAPQADPKAWRELKGIQNSAAQLPADLATPAQVLFFIEGRTGMKVKRAANGAEGFVLDHLRSDVIEKFIRTVAEPEVKACGANPPYAIFCDSLEVAGESWTDDVLAEFQKRRGYDLRPLLPALAIDIGEKTMDIRHDWARTMTEMETDRFMATFKKFAAEHNTKFRMQAYGSPATGLWSYGAIDLPEGEGVEWRELSRTRWATSASHLLGRPVTSSETWTWLHSPVFRATPLDMKAEADLHFLQGVNQLIGHGWPYSPPEAAYPGWRFYASAVFDEKNPWWLVMPDVTAYLQRVSAMMRQGTPANDVALYLPTADAWTRFSERNVDLRATLNQLVGRELPAAVLGAGYGLDFFDDALLEQRGKVEDGALAFGESKYKIVVLPGAERVPLATMRKLEAFAKAGGIVIATRRAPSTAPGFKTSDAERAEVKAIAMRLFEGPAAPAALVQSDTQFAAAAAKKLRPDVNLSPATPAIGFIHRRSEGGEIYFLANTSNTPKAAQAGFRVAGLQAEVWDPLTGKVSPAGIAAQGDGVTTLTVNLEPYESRMFVFTKRTLPAAPAVKVAAPAAPLDLGGGWAVTFGKDAKVVMMDTLRSWTDTTSTRYFSGTAAYEKKVTVPEALLKDGPGLVIDLGQGKPAAVPFGGMGQAHMTAQLDAPVRECAVVYVNGKRAGSVWAPPYRVDVTGLVKAGENTIRIEVANLALNEMSSRPLPNYSALIAKYGDRFQPQDMNQVRPYPAGLLGSIRLLAQ